MISVRIYILHHFYIQETKFWNGSILNYTIVYIVYLLINSSTHCFINWLKVNNVSAFLSLALFGFDFRHLLFLRPLARLLITTPSWFLFPALIFSFFHIWSVPRLLGQYGENIDPPGLGNRERVLSFYSDYKIDLLNSISSSNYSTPAVILNYYHKRVSFSPAFWIIPLNCRAREHVRNLYFL